MNELIGVEAPSSAPLKVVAKLGFLKVDKLGLEGTDYRYDRSGTSETRRSAKPPATSRSCAALDALFSGIQYPAHRKPPYNPPWQFNDFVEVWACNGFKSRKAKGCELELDEKQRRLFRWVILSSRLVSEASCPQRREHGVRAPEKDLPPSCHRTHFQLESQPMPTGSCMIHRPQRQALNSTNDSRPDVFANKALTTHIADGSSRMIGNMDDAAVNSLQHHTSARSRYAANLGNVHAKQHSKYDAPLSQSLVELKSKGSHHHHLTTSSRTSLSIQVAGMSHQHLEGDDEASSSRATTPDGTPTQTPRGDISHLAQHILGIRSKYSASSPIRVAPVARVDNGNAPTRIRVDVVDARRRVVGNEENIFPGQRHLTNVLVRDQDLVDMANSSKRHDCGVKYMF